MRSEEVVLRLDLGVFDPLEESMALLLHEIEVPLEFAVLHGRLDEGEYLVPNSPRLHVVLLAIARGSEFHRLPKQSEERRYVLLVFRVLRIGFEQVADIALVVLEAVLHRPQP